MVRKTIWALGLFLFLAGCATTGGAPGGGTASPGSPPVITAAFASKTLVPGDTWKIYIKATDPDGDMKYVFASVYQTGRGDYPASRTRLSSENGRELNGFVYLNTLVPGGYDFLYFVTLTVTISIQDSAGHYSRDAVFPLSFAGTYEQEPPPPGAFQEQSLGPILVILRPFDADGHSDGFF